MLKACSKAAKILIRDFGEIENLQISSGLISFAIEQMNHDSYFELSKTINEVQQNGNSIRFEQNKIYFKHSNNPQNIKISFLT